MNIQECDIMNSIKTEPYINQRILSELSGHSLGVVNRSIKNLIKDDYLNQDIQLTSKALNEFKEKAPQNAVILAAGYGMRMAPINMETPKAFLEVHGEPLIERLIKQLHEIGITEIYVIVGFMKEKFEYLIDEFGVELVVNNDYSKKNNLHSLRLVLEHLSNTYIIPCDIWCDQNPFRKHELYSWYMVSDQVDNESSVRVNRKMELVTVSNAAGGNAMIGIAYLLKEDLDDIKEALDKLCKDKKYDAAFWEEALYEHGRMIVKAKVVHMTDVVEINTYEQLRELDSKSNHLKSDAISLISRIFNVSMDEIKDITVLKKGMTNKSFLFTCEGKRYVMRIPGEGTEKLINRGEESTVYSVINGKKISDDVIYINPENGYKIARYFENARVCDALNLQDIKTCMKKLRDFHGIKLKVQHEFDIFEKIEYYEKLWNGIPSVYKDYQKTKENVWRLKSYINKYAEEKVLTHIDAVPDNFLFVKNEKGEEETRIIDWEYAGMQDPHVDIAMFCIYALYDRTQVDQLICAYFPEGCTEEIRIKIYCYIAACGLLWSNWCEYKRNLGIEFGEYSLRQYRYAKEYYRIVAQKIEARRSEMDEL